MRLLRRIAPALLLTVLSPLTAEFLLGDFSVRSLPLLIVFLPQYGCGALLIREAARRTGRGWPTMLLLAVAYALIEEGFTTQSLFNPNYAKLRLLDYGYVPVLGTSLNWSLFVLSIHVVWSISTPILIVEGLAADRRTTPWLRRPGLAVTAVLFLLGCALTTFFTLSTYPFVASAAQLAAVAILVLAAIAAAFLLFPGGGKRRGETRRGLAAPGPAWIAILSFGLASAFQLAHHYGQPLGLPAAVPLLAMLLSQLAAVVLIWSWSRSSTWGSDHYLALAAGTVLTYAWVGLSAFLGGHTNLGGRTDAVDVVGQVVEGLAILGLVGVALSRGRRTAAARPLSQASA